MESSFAHPRAPLTVVDQQHELPKFERGRRKLAWAIALGMLLTLPAGFMLIGPNPDWSRLDLFFALCWLCLASGFGTLITRRRSYFDSSDACVLTGLAILGPLPAFVAAVGMDLVQWSSERFRVISLAVNTGSVGWGVLAAAAVLELGGPDHVGPNASGVSYGLLFCAGAVMVIVQYALNTLPLLAYDGGRIRSVIIHEFVRPIPVQLLMIGFGVAATYAYWQFGIWAAVGLLICNVAAWQMLTPWLYRRSLPRSQEVATLAMRARGIADALGLKQKSLRIIQDACGSDNTNTPALRRLADFEAVMSAVMYADQRWDGGGASPGATTGADIPIEARVVAVARAWHELSGRGLDDQDAMAHLLPRAGREYDPEVVAAAARAASAGFVPMSPRLRLAEGWAPRTSA